jgi:hypothetical protein
LRERFWANGFELDQTVENPEPFLAPLPSLWAVSSESEYYRDLALFYRSIFFQWLEHAFWVCEHLPECLSLLQTCASNPFCLSNLVLQLLVETLDQSTDSSSSLSEEAFSFYPGMYLNIISSFVSHQD